ncbi:MAG: FadR/GntR family transcriptional regulator [Bacteroidota bacterium]
MLDNFHEIRVENTSDKIIRQIRGLIISGQLKPGDKLPPERKLSEAFGVGRSHVRDAIKKLEFYGILRTLPQSGTVISGLGINALEGLISDVLQIEEADFKSLVETRVLLEIDGAGKAAERRTTEDIMAMQKALTAYEVEVARNSVAVEEDLLFHLKIAEASKNKVLHSLMLIITPDIIKSFVDLQVCKDDTLDKTLKGHQDILDCIVAQNVEGAQSAMRLHLKDVIDFSLSNP